MLNSILKWLAWSSDTFAVLVADAAGSMTMTELLTRINAQSSVPVAENELKDALRTLGDTISVNWTARTVEAST